MSLSVDILAPEGYGEIIGGGQRLDDYDLLARAHRGAQAAARGVRVVPRPAPLRQRAPSGFGMGIERVVSWICGLDHLREAIPYPRMLYRLYP